MLSAVYAGYLNECRYAECCYAECRGASVNYQRKCLYRIDSPLIFFSLSSFCPQACLKFAWRNWERVSLIFNYQKTKELV